MGWRRKERGGGEKGEEEKIRRGKERRSRIKKDRKEKGKKEGEEGRGENKRKARGRKGKAKKGEGNMVDQICLISKIVYIMTVSYWSFVVFSLSWHYPPHLENKHMFQEQLVTDKRYQSGSVTINQGDDML